MNRGYQDPGDQEVPRASELCPETIDLFAPPTGPKAEEYTEADGRPEKFVKWIQTGEGVQFMLSAIFAARRAMRSGEGRFSVLGYIHHYRMSCKVRINNTFAPWIADALVERDPELLDTIERRARRKPGPS